MPDPKRAQVFAQNVERYFERSRDFDLQESGTNSLAAWFLGPKGENEAVFTDLVTRSIAAHCQDRKDYFPEDPVFVTEQIKDSTDYKLSIEAFKGHLNAMLNELRGSIPLASYRNQSHMYWDITMPAAVGYFAAMLYNQNNVAVEASPVTTFLEMQVGDDLCNMLGFKVPTPEEAKKGSIKPWGHITCDGSVANTESMWSSRNLKFLPVTLAQALQQEPSLAAARDLTVMLANGRDSERLVDLDSWALLNLRIDDVLSLSPRIQADYGIAATVLKDAMQPYNVQTKGIAQFYQKFMPDLSLQPPVIMAPSTMHYSWPKAAALIGLGSDTLESVHVDLDCRMDTVHLRKKLDACLAEKRPVLQVVAVMGTTEESAVDPLDEIVKIREEYRQRGLEFELHLDAAWGGYFASMLRNEGADVEFSPGCLERTPAMTMSPYLRRQYEAFSHADSITVDPHKGGYIPYPAGALCYRNGAQRDLVAFTAPVVYHGGIDPTVGVYGVEGSKPGAAAAGVYLSHRVISTDASGYGKILGKCFWNSKRLYAEVLTLAEREEDLPFIVRTVQRPPAERAGQSDYELKKQIEYIGNEFVPRSNEELEEYFASNADAWNLFREMGSDQIIITYSFNLKLPDGSVNRDIDLCNALNMEVFRRLSLQEFDQKNSGEVPTKPMFVTQSSFAASDYGEPFVEHYANRLMLDWKAGSSVTFIISTTQDPWITNTADGNFIPTLGAVLTETVKSCVHQIWEEHELS
ncbi:MAG: pyridoxal-dependent decarboxylase [Halioglobus sp.]